MTELVIKNDIGEKKMEGLLLFLKSWDIDAEIVSVEKNPDIKKIRIVNRADALSDEQLSEKLSGEISDTLFCSEDDCREIIIPSFVNLENVQRVIDLMVYKTATADSQATQDEVDSIAKEAKKGWWQANREHFIK
jgi:hypothetical protein